MIEPTYFEDIAIDTERRSFGRTITEADIVLHAGQTGDFYPHHMDAEWCKGQEFGQRIAHGTLIFSVAVGLGSGMVNPLAFSYGYDRLRFTKPVFIGDTIKVVMRIASKREYKNPAMGLIAEAVQVTNQRDELVMVCEHLMLVQRRSPAVGQDAAIASTQP